MGVSDGASMAMESALKSREKHAFEEYKKKTKAEKKEMIGELEEDRIPIENPSKHAKKTEAKQIKDPRRQAKKMEAKENERNSEIKKSSARFEKEKNVKL